MNDLMQKGWHFEFYANQLDTINCEARKDGKKLYADHKSLFPLMDAIVAKVRDYEENKSLFGGANE